MKEATCKRNGEKFAVKYVNKKHPEFTRVRRYDHSVGSATALAHSAAAQAILVREIESMKAVAPHPNIVQCPSARPLPLGQNGLFAAAIIFACTSALFV